ncbi:MAG: ankyrin repeat domain-containing protein [Bacteroidota bacterium]
MPLRTLPLRLLPFLAALLVVSLVSSPRALAQMQEHYADLTEDDATLPGGNPDYPFYADAYEAEVAAGQAIAVDLASLSPYMVPRVLVVSPAADTLSNDRYLGSTGLARIVVREAVAGTWTVLASSADGGATGNYALTISVLDEAPAAALHELAAEGDAGGLAVALEGDEDVDRPENYRTPLMFAAQGGHVAAVEVLLEAGADVNAVAGRPGPMYRPEMTLDTPLHIAAEAGQEAVVAVLLEAGADLTAENAYGAPPLVAAVYGGNLAVVQQLLDAGADPDAGEESARAVAASMAEADWVEEAKKPGYAEINTLLNE